jgi:transcriptional regulator with XRE-family HTH domain
MRMTFGERLKQLREENHLSLDAVAKGVGLTRATIHRYENGVITNVPLDTIQQLARFFGVSKPYMVGWSDDRYKGTGDVVVIPDTETFTKAYTVMDEDDRKLLSEIFIRANEKLAEQEWKKIADQK